MRTSWVRHEAALSWCAISEQRGGRIVTHCRGSMPEGDLIEYDDNPVANRCEACERRVAELAQIEAGLEEMRRFVAPDVHDKFDTHDLGGES